MSLQECFYSLTATRGLEKCEKLTRLEMISYISGHTLICGCPVGISFYRKWWDIAVAQRRWISLCHPSLGPSGSDDKSVFDFFFCCDSQQLPPHLWLSPSRRSQMSFRIKCNVGAVTSLCPLANTYNAVCSAIKEIQNIWTHRIWLITACSIHSLDHPMWAEHSSTSLLSWSFVTMYRCR